MHVYLKDVFEKSNHAMNVYVCVVLFCFVTVLIRKVPDILFVSSIYISISISISIYIYNIALLFLCLFVI